LSILRSYPIRRQVVIVTGVLLVPFAIAVVWSGILTEREREVEVREQAGSIATTAAAYLNQYLSGVDSVASALALNPTVVSLDRDASDNLFVSVLRDQPLLLNIVLSDVHGTIMGTALPNPNRGVTTALPYVQQVIATGKPVVSDLIVGVVSGKPTIILAYPVRTPANEVVGAIGIGLNLARLQTLFSSIPLPEGSVVTLTDGQSRVLARSRDAERYIGTVVQSTPKLLRDVPATQTLAGVDGIPRFFGNAIVERGPWLLSVGIPTSVAPARIAHLWRRNVGIGLSAIAAIMIVSLWFAHLLSGNLGRLRSAVRQIADGDLSPPRKSRMPNLELAQLQDGFGTMAANLRQAHEALDHQIEQERKMRETLQSLQRQVVRQERLAAVGVLVSGVAHELNNPLQAILGTVELLERDSAIRPEVLEEIAFIKTQSGRAREIIRNLSRFSSQQTGPPALVDLSEVVAEVVQLRQRDLDTSSITLDIESSTARKVYANFTEVEQVTLNFVINAQQSIEATGRNKGRILIRLSDIGKKVRLEVQDDGPGVTPEDEPKLFQPFFTTKPVGKGTGLGLSVSYGIIESYGGNIGHRPNSWGGATFFFELPSVDPASMQPPSSSSSSTPTDERTPVLQRTIYPAV
jgi:C4-dicarboxylate-specific signal transduction histidine kinase